MTVVALLAPPAIAVYAATAFRLEGNQAPARLGQLLASILGAGLAYAWVLGTLTVMASLAPLYIGAVHPFAMAFAVCYAPALGLAVAWWLALAVLLGLFVPVTAGRAVDISLACLKWCLVVTPVSIVLTLPCVGTSGG